LKTTLELIEEKKLNYKKKASKSLSRFSLLFDTDENSPSDENTTIDIIKKKTAQESKQQKGLSIFARQKSKEEEKSQNVKF
jgi:hypothetical protein